METPSSSTRRITRSQTLAASKTNTIPISRKFEDSEKGVSKSSQRTGGKQQDRSVLIDITNDSPIIGLAMGSLKRTSNSSQGKHTKTPGSGEALLRGQVKTLLQKVEEEEAEISKLSLENHRPFLHLINSSATLFAPTPANTPHVLNLSGRESFKDSSSVQEQFKISQMITDTFDGRTVEGPESAKCFITRSLDFSDKSEGSSSSDCSSGLTNEGGIGGESEGSYSSECSSGLTKEGGIGEEREGKEKSSMEDDDDSVWSIQANASARDYDEEEEEYEDGIEEDYEDYEEEAEEEEEEADDGGLVDELCEGMRKISVNGEKKKIIPKFTGKHTRFVYNSDDELEGGEECGVKGEEASSPGVLHLKGLPTSKGKHLRFSGELDEVC